MCFARSRLTFWQHDCAAKMETAPGRGALFAFFILEGPLRS